MKQDMRFHLAMTYPDGRSFEGARDFRHWPKILRLNGVDFKGLDVLDIATDEGFWAFWAEQAGAKRVMAIDVENAEDYDWGKRVDESWCAWLNEHRSPIGKRAFDFHHQNLNSQVEYRRGSVYQHFGEFDVLFNCGLLYHLRHPLLSLDANRRACRGFMLLETLIDNRLGELTPALYFYPGRAPRGTEPSNWTGLTTGCLAAMLYDAGFEHIYATPEGFPHYRRQTFVAVVDNKYCEVFDRSTLLTKVSTQFLRHVENAAMWGQA